MVYTHKISEEELQLVRKSNKYLAGGGLGNLNSQVIIRRGAGSRIWDVSGNEYIDYLLGSGPMIVGHAHPEVVGFVQEQISRGTTFFATNEYAILLAEEIVDAVPCAEKVRFTSTGGEATFFAIRVARAFRRCDKIIKFEGGFHGMHDCALMSMSPSEPSQVLYPIPDSPGIPESVRSDVIIAPFNDLETTVSLIAANHRDLACLIVEPIQRVIPPKPGFLEGLRDVTREYGIPLIFDEVVTGFRMAYGGAQEYYGVTPDLCTVGKALAGGFPLAAVVGSEEIMNCFAPLPQSTRERPVLQEGTLNGNPVSAVAGLATLSVLRREGTYERLFDVGRRVRDGLQRLLCEAEIPAQVIGEAPCFEVYFTETEIKDYRSTLAGDNRLLSDFNRLLLDRGILKGDTKYYTSTVHTQADVSQTIEAFSSAIGVLKI